MSSVRAPLFFSNAKVRWVLLLAVPAAFGLLIATVACNRAPAQQNVVLVVIDTLRQDRVSAYGYERQTTPVMDRLAAEGALADGLSPTSWTKPATASLLTGLSPVRHQAYRRTDVLSETVRTLAERFADRGYDTFGVSANAWVAEKWGFNQGFRRLLQMGQLGYGNVASGAQVNEALEEHLSSLQEPFFLYVHMVDPHQPYDPPAGWDGQALPADLEARKPFIIHDLQPLSFQERDPEVVQAVSDLYDGEVRAADTALGELLAALGELPLGLETVTVVTSDHGEELQDHGRMGHGHTLYEETTRVPLIFHAPVLVPAGQRLGTVTLEDVAPTLLDLLGLARLSDAPASGGESFDGESIAKRLRSGDQPGSLVDPDSDRPRLLHLDFVDGHALAWVQGPQKLLLTKLPFAKALYDLERDPHEESNLWAADVDQETISSATEALARRYNHLRGRALEASSTSMDPESLKAIRALGYVASLDTRDKDLIPERIGAADPLPLGPMGWQKPATLRPCVTTAKEEDAGQLLGGWFITAREDGRWSGPAASLLLGSPRAGLDRLRITGINFQRRRVRLAASFDGDKAGEQVVRPGPFEVDFPLTPAPAPGTAGLLRLHMDPPFLPEERGGDARILGLYFSSICLEQGQDGPKGPGKAVVKFRPSPAAVAQQDRAGVS